MNKFRVSPRLRFLLAFTPFFYPRHLYEIQTLFILNRLKTHSSRIAEMRLLTLDEFLIDENNTRRPFRILTNRTRYKLDREILNII